LVPRLLELEFIDRSKKTGVFKITKSSTPDKENKYLFIEFAKDKENAVAIDANELIRIDFLKVSN
jgi:hypothetical protein